MSISLTALPALVIPGADFPAWAPWAFAAMGLTTIGVLVYQAVRYFRDNPGDDSRGTNRGNAGGEPGRSGNLGNSGEPGGPGEPDEPGTGRGDRRDGGS